MKNVIVTGGSGFLSYELVRELSPNSTIRLIVVTSNIEETSGRFKTFPVDVIGNEDFLKGNFEGGQGDCLIHTAFCRRNDGRLLLESLRFAGKIFHIAAKKGIDIVNISSQAVYGADEGIELPDESVSMCPGYSYAVAKAAGEILLEAIMDDCGNKVSYTNIRMASLIGPGYVIPDNVTRKFIVNALEGNEIYIVGGKQKFSFLDVRDAAEALYKLIAKEPRDWKTIYNLGHTGQTNIVHMADTVNDCVASIGLPKVPVRIEEANISLNAGMNSGRFYQEFSWKPHFSLKDTILDCILVISGMDRKECEYKRDEESRESEE